MTALLFEPEELRFFSAGADNKLLTTFARGSLEPEDKGRGNMHEDVLTAMVCAAGDRFVTGGRDATLKNWPRAGGGEAGHAQGRRAARSSRSAVVTVYNQPHVAVVLRRQHHPPRSSSKPTASSPTSPSPRVYGAADWVRNELAQQHDPKRREKALKTLAEWKDSAAHRHPRRADRRTTPTTSCGCSPRRLLAAATTRGVGKILEKAIGHGDGKVRVQAFKGLFRAARSPTSARSTSR